jgi:hypothetical protein
LKCIARTLSLLAGSSAWLMPSVPCLAQELVVPVGDPYAIPSPTDRMRNGYRLSGEYLSIYKNSYHSGVDLGGAAVGNVRAFAEGTVVAVEDDPTWGNVVVVRHDNIPEGPLFSQYGHLQAKSNKKVNEQVGLGDVIGTVGCSGTACENPHLHFEIKRTRFPQIYPLGYGYFNIQPSNANTSYEARRCKLDKSTAGKCVTNADCPGEGNSCETDMSSENFFDPLAYIAMYGSAFESQEFVCGTGVRMKEGGVAVRWEPNLDETAGDSLPNVLVRPDEGATGAIEEGPEWGTPFWWWKVALANGITGWAAEDYVEAMPLIALNSAVEIVPDANMAVAIWSEVGRSVIGAQSPEARGIAKGGQTEAGDCGKRWYLVDFESGADGWVAEEFLKPAGGGGEEPIPPLIYPASVLNDTGITFCRGNGEDGSCPIMWFRGQDGEYGRDVTNNDDSDGHAGFSFTKLDADGNPLPASATQWSCVRDNVTHLTWEGKTNGGGLQDKDNTYTWYNPNSSINGGTPGTRDGGECTGGIDCDTNAYVQAINAQGLCGANDWRVPDVRELNSIINNERWGPAIDTEYFPNTPHVYIYYWSSVPVASSSLPECETGCAWCVSTYEASTVPGKRDYQLNVRLVRGRP